VQSRAVWHFDGREMCAQARRCFRRYFSAVYALSPAVLDCLEIFLLSNPALKRISQGIVKICDTKRLVWIRSDRDFKVFAAVFTCMATGFHLMFQQGARGRIFLFQLRGWLCGILIRKYQLNGRPNPFITWWWLSPSWGVFQLWK